MRHKTKTTFSYKQWLTRFWKSKLFYIVGVVVLIAISSSVVKEIVRQITIQHDIKRLNHEIAELEDRNSKISQLLQSLNSSSTLEKEARTKLGVQKEGEIVVSLGEPEVNAPLTAQLEDTSLDTRSNMEKWIDAFLHH